VSSFVGVSVFDTDLNFLFRFGEHGRHPGQFNKGPHGLAVYDDRIIVTDPYNNRLQLFTLDGHLIRVVGRKGDGRGEFLKPLGVAVNNGLMYVSEHHGRRLQVLDADTAESLQSIVPPLPCTGSSLLGAVSASNLHVCVAGVGAGCVFVFDARSRPVARKGKVFWLQRSTTEFRRDSTRRESTAYESIKARAEGMGAVGGNWLCGKRATRVNDAHW